MASIWHSPGPEEGLRPMVLRTELGIWVLSSCPAAKASGLNLAGV